MTHCSFADPDDGGCMVLGWFAKIKGNKANIVFFLKNINMAEAFIPINFFLRYRLGGVEQ